MAGLDPAGPGDRPRPSVTSPPISPAFLTPGGLAGARIGVARKFFGFDPRVDALMEDALRAMRDLGAMLVDPADIPTTGQFDDDEYQVLLYEFKTDLNAYLAGLGPDAPVKTLAELIAFNEQHRDQEMPYFGQETLLEAQAKGPLTEPAYRNALQPGTEPLPLARDRRHAPQAPAGRDRRADRRARLAHRPGRGRPFHRRQFDARGRFGVPQRDRPRRFRVRPAGGALVHRPRVERWDPDPDGPGLRTGDKASSPADVPPQPGGCGGSPSHRHAADRPGAPGVIETGRGKREEGERGEGTGGW